MPAIDFKTMLIYGDSGAGKTALCASAPKVLWMGSRREGGAETLAWMDPRLFYDPKVPPVVREVSSIGETMNYITKELVPGHIAGRYLTGVIELTFYADDVMRSMPVDDKNGWAKYANLEAHVVLLDEILKKYPNLRLIYNALAVQPEKAAGTSGVLIPGKALARKIPAMCNVTAYMRAEGQPNGDTERLLHLSAYGNYMARHRYFNRLPNTVRWRQDELSSKFRDLQDLLHGRAKVDANGYVTRDAPRQIVGLPPLR